MSFCNNVSTYSNKLQLKLRIIMEIPTIPYQFSYDNENMEGAICLWKIFVFHGWW